MVPDGTTIVIGGLMENTDETLVTGIPRPNEYSVCRGPCSATTNQQHTLKKELIVLLTPHIWKPCGVEGEVPLEEVPPGAVVSDNAPRPRPRGPARAKKTR